VNLAHGAIVSDSTRWSSAASRSWLIVALLEPPAIELVRTEWLDPRVARADVANVVLVVRRTDDLPKHRSHSTAAGAQRTQELRHGSPHESTN
jgi:hypothetical protein